MANNQSINDIYISIALSKNWRRFATFCIKTLEFYPAQDIAPESSSHHTRKHTAGDSCDTAMSQIHLHKENIKDKRFSN
jgi:hypothetical protein